MKDQEKKNPASSTCWNLFGFFFVFVHLELVSKQLGEGGTVYQNKVLEKPETQKENVGLRPLDVFF